LVSVFDSESVAGAWVDGASAVSLSISDSSGMCMERDSRGLLLLGLSLLGLLGSVLFVSFQSHSRRIEAKDEDDNVKTGMKWGHTLTGSGAVSAGAEADDSSAAGADPEESEAFVACPFSNASLNRLASRY